MEPPPQSPIPHDSELEQYAARTRRSLIARLHDWQDQQSWDEFYRTYWRLIYGVACKTGLKEDEAWDVVQETVLSVAKQAREHRYDPSKGSFKAWLWQITRWRINDCLRKRATASEADVDIEKLPDFDTDAFGQIWEQEWQQNIIKAATERVKMAVSPRQFQIFDYYVLRGMSSGEVRRKLGVSLAQVYLARHRVGNLLRKEIEYMKSQG
ncbi:MAG: sigma-70 family RNA polymerase sigma factor [Akkermansia sp.]|nr:sigma-70 family RNA polymerase sigma factor [Akkermansia sp.]